MLENHSFIYDKKKLYHAFADWKNRAWEELTQTTGIKIKMLTMFFDSIRRHRQAAADQEWSDDGAVREAAVDLGQVPFPVALYFSHVTKRDVQSFCCTSWADLEVADVEAVVSPLPSLHNYKPVSFITATSFHHPSKDRDMEDSYSNSRDH